MSARLSKLVPIVSAVALSVTLAATPGQKAQVNQDSRGVALKGYDPVAYHDGTGPVEGRADQPYGWNGATWQFANATNRDKFISAPERYAPQFGGYCSWAVSRGYTADIDPQAWRIVDGKLYLNYSKRVQRQWEQDVPGNIAKAVANWPAVLR
jgi:hypothetical protein